MDNQMLNKLHLAKAGSNLENEVLEAAATPPKINFVLKDIKVEQKPLVLPDNQTYNWTNWTSTNCGNWAMKVAKDDDERRFFATNKFAVYHFLQIADDMENRTYEWKFYTIGLYFQTVLDFHKECNNSRLLLAQDVLSNPVPIVPVLKAPAAPPGINFFRRDIEVKHEPVQRAGAKLVLPDKQTCNWTNWTPAGCRNWLMKIAKDDEERKFFRSSEFKRGDLLEIAETMEKKSAEFDRYNLGVHFKTVLNVYKMMFD